MAPRVDTVAAAALEAEAFDEEVLAAAQGEGHAPFGFLVGVGLVVFFAHAEDRAVAAQGDVGGVLGREEAVAAAFEFAFLGQYENAGLENEFEVAAEGDGADDPGGAHVGHDDGLGTGIDGGLEGVGGVFGIESETRCVYGVRWGGVLGRGGGAGRGGRASRADGGQGREDRQEVATSRGFRRSCAVWLMIRSLLVRHGVSYRKPCPKEPLHFWFEEYTTGLAKRQAGPQRGLATPSGGLAMGPLSNGVAGWPIWQAIVMCRGATPSGGWQSREVGASGGSINIFHLYRGGRCPPRGGSQWWEGV